MGRKSLANIRRKEITEAFFRVVAEKGLAKATIREVTEAAGLSPGMLHHYFDNKEAMILEVLGYVTTAYTADFQRGLSQHLTGTDRLRFMISWFIDLDRFDIDWSRTLMEFRVAAKTNPTVSGALQEFFRIGRDVITDIIRDGIESNEFRRVNTAITANMILSSMDGMVSLWLLDPEATPLKEIGEQMTDLFLDYLIREQ